MKLKLLLSLLLFTIIGYGQLQTEGFENSTTNLPPGWQQINVAGPDRWWRLSEAGNPAEPPYEGIHAAYIAPEDVTADATEDWLITQPFLVPENAIFKFYSRLLQDGDQQTSYRLMIHVGNVPTDVMAYTELQQWTELQINPQQTQYTEVNVPIPAAYTGQVVYIAFVMNGDNGDGWLVDDVGVQGSVMDLASFDHAAVKLYPNPAEESITITAEGEILSVEIYDSSGRKCTASVNQNPINISQLADGIYFVKVYTAKGAGIYKIVRQ